MTNVFAPQGVQDLERREGGSPTYGLTKVSISSTDPTPIFNGDLVQRLTGAPLSGGFGEYITQGSSGLTSNNPAWSGIFRGCEFINTAVGRVVWSNFWPGTGASSQADPIAYITRDPGMQFIVQASTAAVIGSSNVGMNIGVLQNGITMSSTIGNTFSGLSGVAVASSTGGAAAISSLASLPFRIKDFFSNFAPGLFPNQPAGSATASQLGFVNGTDNTNPGQIIVVQLNNFFDNITAGSSA